MLFIVCANFGIESIRDFKGWPSAEKSDERQIILRPSPRQPLAKKVSRETERSKSEGHCIGLAVAAPMSEFMIRKCFDSIPLPRLDSATRLTYLTCNTQCRH